jgi:hypothetical protein
MRLQIHAMQNPSHAPFANTGDDAVFNLPSQVITRPMRDVQPSRHGLQTGQLDDLRRRVCRWGAGRRASSRSSGRPLSFAAEPGRTWQNLAETFGRVFTTHAKDLRLAEQPAAPVATGRPPAPQPTVSEQSKTDERRERRLARYRDVWRLHQEGWTGYAIARWLGVGKSTVFLLSGARGLSRAKAVP